MPTPKNALPFVFIITYSKITRTKGTGSYNCEKISDYRDNEKYTSKKVAVSEHLNNRQHSDGSRFPLSAHSDRVILLMDKKATSCLVGDDMCCRMSVSENSILDNVLR